VNRPEITEPPAEHCVAPDCDQQAVMEFTVAEAGRFAARDWQPGDTIGLCVPHGMDVYGTIGAWRPDQVADWLRPEAGGERPNTWKPPRGLYWRA
jgi:hypothetical protein